jgi:ATP-dependent helicase/DNAse subunit B
MDRDVRPCSVDDIFNKDGSIRKGVNWAVEEDVLQGLMDAAEQKATEICGEIRNGRIEPLPRGKGEEDSPCRYCSYRTLCRRNGEPAHPREEGITFRDIAREAAGKITLREDEK